MARARYPAAERKRRHRQRANLLVVSIMAVGLAVGADEERQLEYQIMVV
jgi:hypothetical protein